AISAAHFLVQQGLADRERIVIMGGSSGGYTVLEALCKAPGVFRAGICMYGISNLFTLASDTHKFEAHYLDTLLGPLPAANAIYRERSPIFHAHLIKDPLAIFQGDEDTVVPRSQSDRIVAALKRSGVPHEYHVYAGEGHGWRKPETIEHFLQYGAGVSATVCAAGVRGGTRRSSTGEPPEAHSAQRKTQAIGERHGARG
ncbi:MAG: S9 family peptidase, partial [Chloroflexaceae bacterium]|nr:S9 family peptidase [Chloroflexaceae bacterium]